MNLLIQKHGIQLGDKVSRLKKDAPFIRHYAVYLGINNHGQHYLAENNVNKGVHFVTAEEYFRDSNSIKVESTSKNWEQRQRAVAFAKHKIGHKYDLLNYNCEHFANEATTGLAVSKQVGFGIGIAAFFVGGIILRNLQNS